MYWKTKQVLKLNNLYLQNNEKPVFDEVGHPYIILTSEVNNGLNLKHELLTVNNQNISNDSIVLSNHYLIVQGTRKKLGEKHGNHIRIILDNKVIEGDTMPTYLFSKNLGIYSYEFIKSKRVEDQPYCDFIKDDKYTEIVDFLQKNNKDSELYPTFLDNYILCSTDNNTNN